MVYNLTQIAVNNTGIVGLVQGVNQVLMFGWLGVLLLLGLSVVFFTSFMFTTGDAKKSMAATSFIIFGLNIFLFAMNLVPNTAFYIILLGAAIAIGFSWKGDG